MPFALTCVQFFSVARPEHPVKNDPQNNVCFKTTSRRTTDGFLYTHNAHPFFYLLPRSFRHLSSSFSHLPLCSLRFFTVVRTSYTTAFQCDTYWIPSIIVYQRNFRSARKVIEISTNSCRTIYFHNKSVSGPRGKI